MGTRIPGLSRRNFRKIVRLRAKKHENIIVNNGIKTFAIGKVGGKFLSGKGRIHSIDEPENMIDIG